MRGSKININTLIIYISTYSAKLLILDADFSKTERVANADGRKRYGVLGNHKKTNTKTKDIKTNRINKTVCIYIDRALIYYRIRPQVLLYDCRLVVFRSLSKCLYIRAHHTRRFTTT